VGEGGRSPNLFARKQGSFPGDTCGQPGHGLLLVPVLHVEPADLGHLGLQGRQLALVRLLDQLHLPDVVAEGLERQFDALKLHLGISKASGSAVEVVRQRRLRLLLQERFAEEAGGARLIHDGLRLDEAEFLRLQPQLDAPAHLPVVIGVGEHVGLRRPTQRVSPHIVLTGHFVKR
jgi:hypothetical protein